MEPFVHETHASHPLAHELDVAQRLARHAGDAVRRCRARGFTRDRKGTGELVTAADLEADAIICEGLRRAFPDDAVLSEEAPDSGRRLSRRRVWIVDPLDGTRDFARGGDEHAVSIGLAIDGQAVVGAVYNPARDEMFASIVGVGLLLDGARAHVSGAAGLDGARVTISRDEACAPLERTAPSLRLRPVSSVAYKLARVSAGLDDGTFSLRSRREWDVCAGVALVVAGGGRVTALDGGPLRFNRREVRLGQALVAAGPALHAALSRALARLGLGRT
jgi:myo-inositol-1(or 4)-monophosphatase